jgi:hypothetical protein
MQGRVLNTEWSTCRVADCNELETSEIQRYVDSQTKAFQSHEEKQETNRLSLGVLIRNEVV